MDALAKLLSSPPVPNLPPPSAPTPQAAAGAPKYAGAEDTRGVLRAGGNGGEATAAMTPAQRAVAEANRTAALARLAHREQATRVLRFTTRGSRGPAPKWYAVRRGHDGPRAIYDAWFGHQGANAARQGASCAFAAFAEADFGASGAERAARKFVTAQTDLEARAGARAAKAAAQHERTRWPLPAGAGRQRARALARALAGA